MTIGYDPSARTQSGQSGVNWRHMSSGAVSGCATRFVCQPFDVIKIRFQLQLEPIRRRSTTSKYRTVSQTIATIAREEGLSTLWRAHLCAQLLSVVYGTIQFTSFELYTQMANKRAKQLSPDLVRRHQPFMNFMCGSLAGLSAALVAHPIDVIRTRLIAQSIPKTYTSTPNAFKTIVRSEGYRALFRGLVPTLIQIAPNTGIQFTVYNITIRCWEQMDEQYKQNRIRLGEHIDDTSNTMHNKLVHFEETFICGGVAGAVAKFAVYPLDLIKKRLQVEGFQSARQGFGAVASYNGAIDCAVKIVKTENLLAFYKGLSPSLMKAGITAALNFSIYENVYKYLSNQ